MEALYGFYYLEMFKKFCHLMEVYRLLSPNENPCDGLSYTSDPNSIDLIDSIVKHVAFEHVGNPYRTFYISACGSLEAAVNLRRYRKQENGQIVKISNLLDDACHDLRTMRKRLHVLQEESKYFKHCPITIQRYHYFAETFQVVLLEGKVPSENITIGKEIEVYRLLRTDENPDRGLCAKDMNSSVSIFQHVTEGSYCKSKFISTCGTLAAALHFRSINQHNRHQNGSIVKITITDLSSMIFYDLRTRENRLLFLPSGDGMNLESDLEKKYHSYADAIKEVLIQDYVPSAYIDVLKD